MAIKISMSAWTISRGTRNIYEEERMNLKRRIIWILFLNFLVIMPGISQQVYQETDGLVIMEMEHSESPLGQWVLKTDNPGYNSDGFLEFAGNTINGGDPDSPREYRFKITTPGTYDIKLRARKRLDGEASDKCNDCYVRLEGDFTSGSEQVSLRALQNDTKLYGGPETGWGWAGDLDTYDADHTQARYVFESGEEYLLVLSGRSIRYQIDRIVFVHSDADLADAVSGPESSTAVALSQHRTSGCLSGADSRLNILHGPSGTQLQYYLSRSGRYQIGLYHINGRRVLSHSFVSALAGTGSIDLSSYHITNGSYIVLLSGSGARTSQIMSLVR